MSLSPTNRELLERLLAQARDAHARGEHDHRDACRATLGRLAPDHPEVILLESNVNWSQGGPGRALSLLTRGVALHPDHADLHYALGCAFGELDERDAHANMTRHFLRTLALDTVYDADRDPVAVALLPRIEQEAAACLDSLPEDLAGRLDNVAVVLEPRPRPDLVEEGFDPRALGLFEGPDDRGLLGEQVAVRSTRIVLFTANLLAEFPDPDELIEQIRVTVLHEVGHFFGLSEDKVARLGLA